MIQKTKQTKLIFPKHMNDHNILFGGYAMKWMDELAYITALRHIQKKLITISVKNIEFLQAIKSGMIINICGEVVKVGNVKLEILVEIYIENPLDKSQDKAVQALFVMAAVNDKMKPTRMY
jgi:acyl-CoA hydrolase